MFEGYLKLGIDHILDIDGIDHLLFVVVLTIAYHLKAYKKLFWMITAFTVGHSISLFIAGMGWIKFDKDLIEFLIPITIILAAFANIYAVMNNKAKDHRYGLVAAFGLIHGVAFSSFFASLLSKDESIIIPLLAFNIGVEVGQILIVAATLLIGFISVDLLKISRKYFVLIISIAIILKAVLMMVE